MRNKGTYDQLSICTIKHGPTPECFCAMSFPMEDFMKNDTPIIYIQGTDNILLQNAFSECKENNHVWLKDIHHFLANNGLGHIWNNVANLKGCYVKSKIDQQSRDQYNQYHIILSRARGVGSL